MSHPFLFTKAFVGDGYDRFVLTNMSESLTSPQTNCLDQWFGFERVDFNFSGRDAIVVKPHHVAATCSYIWRTEFFGHEPQLDIALLERGWHVVYLTVSDLYGAPCAIEAMRPFQTHLETEFGLHGKTVLEGMSRGGLYAFNYAAAYPEKVAALYLDNPVLDIRSWPAGQGKGPGNADNWRECFELYGLTPETERSIAGPLDRIEPVAAAKIPIVAVCGDADEVVPFDENMAVLASQYEALNALIKLIVKEGFKHHPHCLVDPTPLVEFLEGAVLA
jgi:pimeloyl-ACP methyl ester carboxylesterase